MRVYYIVLFSLVMMLSECSFLIIRNTSFLSGSSSTQKTPRSLLTTFNHKMIFLHIFVQNNEPGESMVKGSHQTKVRSSLSTRQGKFGSNKLCAFLSSNQCDAAEEKFSCLVKSYLFLNILTTSITNVQPKKMYLNYFFFCK